MSQSDVTKMLLLGAVAIFEPVNGYQIRRELLSWGIEEWANIRPGSIYNGLSTLTKAGALTRHDLADDGRDVAVYEITDRGRSTHHDLVIDALATPEIYSSVAFQAAFTQSSLLERTDVAAALRKRIDVLRDWVSSYPATEDAKSPYAPQLVMHSLSLWPEMSTAEIGWLQHTLTRIENGDFSFRGDPTDWQPAPDDPGHQMSAERERYRRQLGHGPS